MKNYFLMSMVTIFLSFNAAAAERYVYCDKAASQFAFNRPGPLKQIQLQSTGIIGRVKPEDLAAYLAAKTVHHLNVRQFVYDRLDNQVMQIVVTYQGRDYDLMATDANDPEVLGVSCSVINNSRYCELGNLPKGLKKFNIRIFEYYDLNNELQTKFGMGAQTDDSVATEWMSNITPMDTGFNCQYNADWFQG